MFTLPGLLTKHVLFYDKKIQYKMNNVYEMLSKVTKEHVHRLLSSFTHSGAERAVEVGSRRPKGATGMAEKPTGEWGPEPRGKRGGRRGQWRGEAEEGSKAMERLQDTLGGGLTAGSCAQEKKHLCWEAWHCPAGPGPTCSTLLSKKTLSAHS